MAGSSNRYAVTPHKISLSILLQLFIPCSYSSNGNDGEVVAATAKGLSSHQCRHLSYLLITLFTPFDNFLEPSLEELIWQLKEVQQAIAE
ncbi:hypothetical protein SUGI_0742930 [Cryptomeria japonica]|nr:hypothetical protein SUGI_0742930 [Cryptomeria japonica]